MKKYLLLFAIFSVTFLFAQNELKARIEYDEAEKAFANNDFEECLNHAVKTEENLGKWTSKVSFLKLVALDKLCDYTDLENKYTKQQQKEIGLYMAYANKNQQTIDIDRYKIAYKIEEQINILVKEEKERARYTIQDKINYADFKKNKKMFDEMAEYINGEKALGLKEYDKALSLFKAASVKGNPLAESAIGVMYEVGLGIPENGTEAIKWYRKAAEKGNMQALYRMKDVDDNDKNNFVIIFRCANAGYEDCYSYLASCYRFGKGVGNDYSKAVQYYTYDANNGEHLSMENIAELYYEGGYGLAQSKQETVKWYLKAAQPNSKKVYRGVPFPGSKKAMYKLYEMYNTGDGVEKNTSEAFNWLLKMAEINEDDQTATEFDWIGKAYYILGTAYLKGLSVEKNYTEALRWFTKGAIKTKGADWITKDNVACTEKVIQFYNEGIGIKKDKKLAAEWQAKYEAVKKEAR